MAWRIMVVDDEPDVRLIVKSTLDRTYEVVEAHDGLDALEKIERYEPDFVVMDVMMPLMNGFEACQAVRNSQRFHDLPVMFLSALGSKDDMMKGYSSGANLYLTKPFDPPRLLKNIDVFFEKTPPPVRPKRYTMEQIAQAEKDGHPPAAPGSGEFDYSGSNPTKELHKPPVAARPSPVPDSAPASSQPVPSPDEPAALPRVLVVDDDPEMCSLMRISLMDFYEVVFAHDGMEAIERLVKYQPDMLIIDVMLPKMNGYQLCQSMRSNRAFARMPILMCSAKGADRDISLAKRIGANEYLVKPFSATELIAKVDSLKTTPGFRIRPKTLSYDRILEMEAPKDSEDVFTADEDSARSGKDAKALRSFLAREGDKSATAREDQPEKKKRRMFGFGGKD